MSHCTNCGSDRSSTCNCATGPWRSDVENAPKDRLMIVEAKSGEIEIVHWDPVYDSWKDDKEYTINTWGMLRFAEFNEEKP